MVVVRLRNGKKFKSPDAEYVVVVKGGNIQLLNHARELLTEFPWGDVIAYSTIGGKA